MKALSADLLLMQLLGVWSFDWAVFHTCSESHVVTRPFGDGFQPTPWQCCGCGETVQRGGLMYSLISHHPQA